MRCSEEVCYRAIDFRLGPDYRLGQWVWLSTHDLRLRLPCRKLSPRYVGLLKILRQINPVSYELDLPLNYRVCSTIHVSLLKTSPKGDNSLDEQRPPPLVTDGVEAFRVRSLLNSWRHGRKLQYLVDWEGYGPKEHA